MANNISEAAQIIKDGGLVAFPTETVYGVGPNRDCCQFICFNSCNGRGQQCDKYLH